MKNFRLVFGTRFKLFWRRAQAEQRRGLLRFIGLVAIVIFILFLVFASTYGCGYYLRIQGTPELVRPMLGSMLFAILMGLLLSCLGHTAVSFFTAHDLWFWNSTPIGPGVRFLDRMVGAAAASVPATLVLGGVAVIGLLMGAGCGLTALLRGCAILLLIPIFPLSVGVIFSHLGGIMLPAGRIRRLSIFLVGLVTCLLLVWLRSSRLEQFLTEEGAARFLASVKGIENIGPVWLPSNLAAAFVVDKDWSLLGAFMLQICTLAASAYLIHRLTFLRARDLADDESPTGLKRGSWQEKMIAAYASFAQRDTRYLVRKDLLAFIRDPSQWSQLMLLVGIAIIYLINCQALLTGFERFEWIRNVILPAVHVGIVCFISAGLSARFAFVQVSLEGPAVWVLESSPLSPRDILIGKVLVAYPLVGLFPLLIGVLGSFVFGFSLPVMIVCFLFIGWFGLAFTVIGVGKGAVSPLFDAVSVSEMAMAPGAMSTMILGICLCAAGSLSVMFGGGILRYFHLWPGGLFAALAALPLFTALTFLAWQAFVQGENAFLDRRYTGYSLRLMAKDQEEVER
jgi:ABC-2 type transport system permease protein